MIKKFENTIREVQVNVPFRMLETEYLEKFISYGLNPEIGMDAIALDQYSLSEYKKIAELFKNLDRRITVHGPFIDLSPGSLDPMIFEVTEKRFLRFADAVSVIKPVTVVCHTGYEEIRHGFFKDEWLERSLGLWRILAEKLFESGIRLMLENVYESSPEIINILLNELSSYNPGFCLDTGHMNVFSSLSSEDWLNSTSNWLGQIHFHDNNGNEDQHLPPGQGNCELMPVVEFYKKNPDIIMTLEPHEEKDLWGALEYVNGI